MEEKLLRMLCEVCPHLDPQTVTMDSHLQADLGLDSARAMLLLLEMEEEFEVEWGDRFDCETVGDVCGYLRELIV